MERFSKEQLDYYYSPSQFSKKGSPKAVVDLHLERTFDATQIARQVLRCELGIEYQPGGQTLDIYYPSNINDDTDVLIYIHGGYWQALGIENSGFAAIPCTRNNIILVALGYDLAPKVNLTTIVEQCKLGCSFIAKKFPGKRLYVSGHSAGGHITALMLTTQWSDYSLSSFPFAGGIIMSGVYNISPIQKCYVNDPLKLTDDEVVKYSPLNPFCTTHLTIPSSMGIRYLLIDGEQESPEFKKQRDQYCKVLSSYGIHFIHHEIPDEDHFTLVERLSEETYTLTQIIIDFIKEVKHLNNCIIK